MYDQFGFDAERRTAVPPDHEPGADFDFGGCDVGGSTGTNFRDLFSQFFRGGASGAAQEYEEPGSDLEYGIEIDFWEAVRGTVKKVTISRLEPCSTCGGTGAVGTPQTCEVCGGTGPASQISGRMRFNVACAPCGGTGKIQPLCPVCGGQGRVRRAWPLEVRVTAGPQEGCRVPTPAH